MGNPSSARPIVRASSDKRPVVAVWNFASEDKSEPTQKFVRQLADLTRVRLSQTDLYQVVDKNTQDAIFSTQADHLKYCDEESCAIQGGKLLSAEKLVFGNLMRFGDSCTLALRMLDVQKGAVERSVAETGSCFEEQLPSLVSRLIYSLSFGITRGEEELKKTMTPPKPPEKPSKPVSTGRIVMLSGIGLAVASVIGGAILMAAAPRDPSGAKDLSAGLVTLLLGGLAGALIATAGSEMKD